MDAEMLAARLILFVALGGAGVLMLWLARAGASGRLKRNQLAGIRTRRTLASDEAWHAAHVRAERPTRAAGIVAIAAGVVILPVPAPAPAIAVIAVTAAIIMIACAGYGAVVGGRAADAATAADE
ncbi:SdpI family protein [Microbacterium sp. GXF7504]